MGRLVWTTATLNKNTVGIMTFWAYSIARFTKSAPHNNFEETPTAGHDEGDRRVSEKDATENDEDICVAIEVSLMAPGLMLGIR